MTDAQFKLVLVDGLNIVRRVYEANLAPDSDAKALGATKASMSSLRRAFREHQPTHALLAFDFGGNTWRHDLYAEYRASRKPMPEPLKNALPAFKEQLQDFGFNVQCVPGVEADDVIGTAAHRTEGKPFEVVVMSTDKDLVGLIRPGLTVRDHFKPEWRDAAWCVNKFGVPPELLHDLLALTGDSVDGIPGVYKVGAKTAAKWLLEHGSLDGVLAAADSIKGKVGENLRAGLELARLSRKLVALKTDVEMDIPSCAALRMPDGFLA